MTLSRFILVATASVAIFVVCLAPYPAAAQSGSALDGSLLSAYWDPNVTRWEPLITRYSAERNIDPDLIAAVIWKESRGIPKSRGPAGAVGLMMVMPFSWRPSPEELETPWVNLFWGARALAQTIQDGNGDIYYSLAAYNGSWEKIERPNPRRYASSVLGHYARAVAVRHGLPADGDWVAVLAADGVVGPRTLTVLGPQRPLARYTERPCLQVEEIPSVPQGTPPHATVITFEDERGVECRVQLWILDRNGSPLLPATDVQPTSSGLIPLHTPDDPGEPTS
jgi:hypothetical protein